MKSSQPVTSGSSPLTLYPADNPGNVLVSHLLDGDNYPTWMRAMKIALGAKNKFVFVDGTYPRPNPKDESDAAALWNQCDLMVMSWIYNALKRELQETVLYAKSAWELWLELEIRYAQGNGARIYDLKRRIAVLQQDNLSVSGYYSVLKVLWDELDSYLQLPECTCGALSSCTCKLLSTLSAMAQSEKVFQFLMGLNDIYGTIRTQILSMDPLPPSAKAYALILQEERHRGLCFPQVPTDNSAFVLTRQSDFKKKSICSHCHRQGHTKEKCFTLHGFPPNFGRRNTRVFSVPKGSQVHVVTDIVSEDIATVSPSHESPSARPEQFHQLTTEQYNQLVSFINSSSTLNFAGLTNQDGDWTGSAT